MSAWELCRTLLGPPFLFAFDNTPDMARATVVAGPVFSGEIPMLSSNREMTVAVRAGPMPDAINESAAVIMDAAVRELVKNSEVGDLVVELVAVDVVDVVPG